MHNQLTQLQRETLNTVIMRLEPYRLDHRDGDIACALLALAARGMVRFDRYGTAETVQATREPGGTYNSHPLPRTRTWTPTQ